MNVEQTTTTPVERVETVRVTKDPGYERREHRVRDYVTERRARLDKTSQLVWLATGLLEGLLALRFLLKMIGANPANAFAQLLYGFTDLFLSPFLSLTPAPQAGALVLETSTLIAMAVYALAAWAIVRAVWVIFDKPRGAELLEIRERRGS